MQNSTPPTSSRHPAQNPMYIISKICISTGKKYYWNSGGKQYAGNWSTRQGYHAYWEAKHAKAVMTRKGWKNNSFYTYHIEEI